MWIYINLNWGCSWAYGIQDGHQESYRRNTTRHCRQCRGIHTVFSFHKLFLCKTYTYYDAISHTQLTWFHEPQKNISYAITCHDTAVVLGHVYLNKPSIAWCLYNPRHHYEDIVWYDYKLIDILIYSVGVIYCWLYYDELTLTFTNWCPALRLCIFTFVFECDV